MVFSLTGFLIALSIFLPNLLFVIFPPINVPTDVKDTGLLFTILERIGQVGCIAILVLSESNYNKIDVNIWFVFMIISILTYYILWIRYVVKGHDFAWAFEPLSFIPIPMALFPVLAFALAALWGNSIYLGIAVVMLAVGHIVNSWHTYKVIKAYKKR